MWFCVRESKVEIEVKQGYSGCQVDSARSSAGMWQQQQQQLQEQQQQAAKQWRTWKKTLTKGTTTISSM